MVCWCSSPVYFHLFYSSFFTNYSTNFLILFKSICFVNIVVNNQTHNPIDSGKANGYRSKNLGLWNILTVITNMSFTECYLSFLLPWCSSLAVQVSCPFCFYFILLSSHLLSILLSSHLLSILLLCHLLLFVYHLVVSFLVIFHSLLLVDYLVKRKILPPIVSDRLSLYTLVL